MSAVAAVRLRLDAEAAEALLTLLAAGKEWRLPSGQGLPSPERLEVTPVEGSELARAVGITGAVIRAFGRAASLARPRRPGAEVEMSPDQVRAWHRVAALASIEPELDVWCGGRVVVLRQLEAEAARAWRAWSAVVREAGEWER